MKAFPNSIFTDSVGASETGFQGTGLQDANNMQSDGPMVSLGPNSVVLDDDNRPLDLATNVGKVGRLARGGNVPVGYYKDPEKSAKTFLEIDGQRYSVPGDFARIEPDGKVTLLGRGSNCVNTGGEKVYPEEVEEVLKLHPSVADAVVVGVPDEKWGEAITAVVEPNPGTEVDEADVIAYVKQQLAAYKAPKRVLTVATIGRAPNGKVDYRRLKGEATDRAASG